LVLQGCPHVMVHVLDSFSFVHGDQQGAMANATKILLQVKGCVAQISSLVEVCQTGMQRWIENAAKVLFVVNEAGLELSQCSQFSIAVGAPTSPKCAEVSCASMIEAGLNLLRSSLGDGHVATLLVSNSNVNSPIRTTLNGSDVVLGASDYSPFFQSWHYAAWPVIENVVGHSAAAPVAVEQDGWRWCSHADKPLRSDYLNKPAELLTLLEVRLFQERVLTAEEELMLNGVSMHHIVSEVSRLISRDLLLSMHGHDGLPSRQVLQDLCPCHGSILGSTGQFFAEGLHGSEQCGTTRWCLPCEMVLLLVLSSPHASALTDVCKAWIDKCLLAWTRQDLSAVSK